MDAYRDKIQFKSEAGDYTEETYTEYKEAYDALMALDSSTEMYQQMSSRQQKQDLKMHRQH